MAEFLTTTKISARLEDIIREAEKELVLVSPYVQFSGNLIDRLKDADEKGVRIILIYRDELSPKEREKLDTLKNLSLYCHPNLHAKCYYNEKQLIITSMNLYDFSEKRNREMGVLVQMEEHDGVYSKAAGEVRSILRSEHIKRESRGSLAGVGKVLRGVVNVLATDVVSTPGRGSCIRCGRLIEFDRERPYCAECYGKWAKYKRKTYPENFCHRCGKPNKGNMSEPLCADCSQKHRRT